MSEYEHEQPLVGSVGEARMSARVPDSVRRVARWLALPWVAYLIAFMVAFGTYRYAYEQFQYQGPTGDEPSYVLDAMSMARDGDRDLSNQFSYTDTKPLIKLFGIPAIPHGQKLTDAGFILWHGAGLGFALVPGVWIGDAMGDPVKWMRYELMLIDALAAVALLGVLRKLALGAADQILDRLGDLGEHRPEPGAGGLRRRLLPGGAGAPVRPPGAERAARPKPRLEDAGRGQPGGRVHAVAARALHPDHPRPGRPPGAARARRAAGAGHARRALPADASRGP